MGWLHRQERRAAGAVDEEEVDDGTPKWRIEQDEGGSWDSESHSRPRD